MEGRYKRLCGATLKPSDIVKSYLREHSDTPSRTIAKYLYGKHPELWSSEDACYQRVRYYRGATGGKDRKKRKGQEQFKPLPKAAKKREPLVKLNDKGRWAIFGDLHVPYHHEQAIEAAVRRSVDNKCEHLILNGDILDAYQQSYWVRDPRLRSVDEEIKVAKELIKAIEHHYPGRKVYKIGNHEARIEAYLYQNAPRMIGISKWDLRKVLKEELELDDSWTMIGSKQLYMLGKLHGYHGHELPRGLTNPVSVGRGVWLRTKQVGFTNHWHSTSTHVETNGSKTKTWVCFSLGCLCDLHPDYAPVNKWNHGAAEVEIGRGGAFSEFNYRIVDGRVY